MSVVTYTASGPWVNNNPPGISASVLTAMEAFLSAGWFDSQITSDGAGGLLAVSLLASGAIKPNAAATTTNGNTNGTVTLWQPFAGTFKLVMLFFNAFRNAGANQDLVLPTAFVSAGFFYIGNIVNPTTATSSGINFMHSGIAQNVNEYNGQNAAPATGVNAKAMNIGAIQSGFDTIRILGTVNATGNAMDFMLIAGA